MFYQEHGICTSCLTRLPLTHFTGQPGNEVEEMFFGLVPIQHATALFYYEKGSRYQQLIHRFKYHNETEVGTVLGKYLGSQLKQSRFDEVDALIPVPLHARKLKIRGFNQSEIIANGMAHNFCKPVLARAVERHIDTVTQTHRSRFDRSQNVHNIFRVTQPAAVKGKHLLLIDDVVTTGATLESLAHVLLAYSDVKISIATLGYASR